MSETKIEAITPVITVEDDGNGDIKLWFGAAGKPKSYGHVSKDNVVRLRDFLNRVLEGK